MLYLSAIKIPEVISLENFYYFKSVVTEERKNKIDRLFKYEEKLRTLFSEILLRYVLQNKFNLSQKQIHLKYNNYGKPSLCGLNNLFFNISHSGSWIICGVGDDNIGLDIEEIKEINMNVAKRFFTKEEYNSILAVSKQEQIQLFYKYWILKESYIKAEGKGLGIPLNSFFFQIDRRKIILLCRGHLSERYNFMIYEFDRKYEAAVCWHGNKNELFDSKFDEIKLEHVLQYKFF